MTRTGRPRKEISEHDFEQLCAMQCTEIEICDFFGCCEDTLNAWCKRHYKDDHGKAMTFSEVFAEKRSLGKVSLRRSQWRLAEKNPTMAIFLGKQYLGQKDQPEIVVSTGDLADAIEEAFETNHPGEAKGDDDE